MAEILDAREDMMVILPRRRHLERPSRRCRRMKQLPDTDPRSAAWLDRWPRNHVSSGLQESPSPRCCPLWNRWEPTHRIPACVQPEKQVRLIKCVTLGYRSKSNLLETWTKQSWKCSLRSAAASVGSLRRAWYTVLLTIWSMKGQLIM